MKYQQLDEQLRSHGLMQQAAEYHGILCGQLCWHDQVSADLGLNEGVIVESGSLVEFQAATKASLDDEGMGFAPLLPKDSEALALRIQALGQWASGFLYGLASQPGFQPDQASEASQEAIKDLAAISQAESDNLEEGLTTDEDETDYAELVEYVRVVVQVIYLELRNKKPSSNKQRLDS